MKATEQQIDSSECMRGCRKLIAWCNKQRALTITPQVDVFHRITPIQRMLREIMKFLASFVKSQTRADREICGLGLRKWMGYSLNIRQDHFLSIH